MKRIVLIVALCLLANMSFAESIVFKTGNTIYPTFQDCEKWENGDKRVSAATCGMVLGYVTGVYDTYGKLGQAGESVTIKICSPDVTAKQLQDVVYDYLKENPRDRHKAASALVVLAMYEAWPCPEE